VTILLATQDDDLLEAARTAFAATCSTFGVARSALGCLEGIRRMAPDLVILDDYLPWGGADGVLAVLEEGGLGDRDSQYGESWIREMPILLLNDGTPPVPHPTLRTYAFPRICCGRKLREVIEMFESECAGAT
jgi:hypothetical protein